MLRATVVCADGDALLAVYRAIEVAFGLREGNGRLKNLLGTKAPTPPRMLLNVVLPHEGGAVVAEIQLHLRRIKVRRGAVCALS